MSDLVPDNIFRDLNKFFNKIEQFLDNQFTGSIESLFDGVGLKTINVKDSPEKITLELVVPEDMKDKMDIRVDGKKVEIIAQTSTTKNSTQSAQKSWKRIYHCYNLPEGVLSEKADVVHEGSKLKIKIPKK